MLRLQGLKVLRLIALSGLLFAVRAFAQFEVAPDHFDSAPASQKNTASKKAKTERTATTHPLRNLSVTTGPTVQAGQNSGANARGAAQRRQPRRNLQRADHAQVAATHRNHDAEEPSVAVSPQ